jgi:hypothetical protein
MSGLMAQSRRPTPCSGCLRPLNTACYIRALVRLGFDESKLLTGS